MTDIVAMDKGNSRKLTFPFDGEDILPDVWSFCVIHSEQYFVREAKFDPSGDRYLCANL